MQSWEEQVFDYFSNAALARGLINPSRLDSITDTIAAAGEKSPHTHLQAMRSHAHMLEQMLEATQTRLRAVLLDELSDDLLEHVIVCAGSKDAFWIRISCKRLFRLATACAPKTISGALSSVSRVIWALEPAVWSGLEVWLLQHEHCLCAFAARYGDLEVINLLLKRFVCDERTMMQAVIRGDLPTVKLLLQLGCPREHDCYLAAAFHGHGSILDYLASDAGTSFVSIDRQDLYEHELCPQAAAGGHLQLLMHLHEKGCEWGNTCISAARSGHLDVMIHAIENGCPLIDPKFTMKFTSQRDLLAAAAESNNLDVVQWVLDHVPETLLNLDEMSTPSMPMFYAARNGNLAMLKVLDAFGCPWDWRMSSEAARADVSPSLHLELAQWLKPRAEVKGWRRTGYWDGGTWMLLAAQSNNMPLLLWLRAEGCAWEGRECQYAAMSGQLGVLEWLRASGCPWGPQCYQTILSDLDSASCIATLKWLHDHGAPFDEDTWSGAFMRQDMQILSWLHSVGCPWGRGYLDRDLSQEVLDWARQTAKCPWPMRPEYW